jgi:peptidoglycan/LPS O-acetylase OafA/YrhL
LSATTYFLSLDLFLKTLFQIKLFWCFFIILLIYSNYYTLASTIYCNAFILFDFCLCDCIYNSISIIRHKNLKSLSYSSDIYFWITVKYFYLQTEGASLLHTWSLAVEEQFYILFPAVFLFFYQRFALSALPVVVIAAVASFALNIVTVEIKPEATSYLLSTRAWEVLIGAALALYALKRPEVMVRCGPLGLPGAALIAASSLIFDRSVQAPGWFAALPTLGLGLIRIRSAHAYWVGGRPCGSVGYPIRLILCTGQ